MLKRVQAVLTGVLVAVMLAVGWQQWKFWNHMDGVRSVMHGFDMRLSEIHDKLKIITPNPANSAARQPDEAIEIRVIDDDGKAIKNASLTFGWTDATRSYFDSYVVATDYNGAHRTPLTFRDKQLDSVTAYVPGYAFVTESLNRPFKPGAMLTLTLPKATKQRLLILAPSVTENLPGRPLADAEVRVTSRTSANGRSSNSQWLQLKLRTDNEGVVEIDCAAPGDEIQLNAWEPDKTWVAGPIPIKTKPDDKTSGFLTVELRPMSTPSSFGGGGGMF